MAEDAYILIQEWSDVGLVTTPAIFDNNISFLGCFKYKSRSKLLKPAIVGSRGTLYAVIKS